MHPKRLLGLLIPLAFAGLFVRLGVWQLARHDQRSAYNARVQDRLSARPVPFEGIPADTALLRGQRVMVSGRFRYDLEQVAAGRANEGGPSVHLLTPLERPGSDTLVIVSRGWVYSPDAAEVDLAQWREGDTVSLAGYTVPLPPEGPAAPSDAAKPLRSVTMTSLRTRLGRPVASAMVVMTSDSALGREAVPQRLGPPSLVKGNHWSYAIQWFSFAAIAVVGGLLMFRRAAPAPRSRL